MSDQPTTPAPDQPAAPAPSTADQPAAVNYSQDPAHNGSNEPTPAAPAPTVADQPAPAPQEQEPAAKLDPVQVEADKPAPAPVAEPASQVKAGDVVHFAVENPYTEAGPRVETHAGLVVQAGDGRARVIDLGDVTGTADFPVDALQLAD